MGTNMFRLIKASHLARSIYSKCLNKWYLKFYCALLLVSSLFLAPAWAATLNSGVVFKHRSLDPIYCTRSADSFSIKSMFETLVSYDESGKISPAAAESWSMSDDLKTYTFKLRKNLKWSDGVALSANDYLNTFQRMHDSKYADFAKPSYLVSFIENSGLVTDGKLPLGELGVKAIDAETLVIKLERPTPFFLSILTYPAFSPTPAHALEKYGASWSDVGKIVVNGFYSPEKVDDHEMIFSRNNHYWDAKNIYYDNFNVKYIDDHNDAFHQLLLNELDVVFFYTGQQLGDMNEPGSDILKAIPESSILTTNYLALNLNYPALSDKKVRQAISMALDRTKLVEEVWEKNKVAYSFAAPSELSGWDSIQPAWADKTQEERIKMARALMTEAGYTSFKRLKLELKVSLTAVIGSLIEKALSDIWIDVVTTKEENKETYLNLSNNNYQIALAAWKGDYDDPETFLGILRDDSSKNYSQWKNAQYMQLLNSLALPPYDVAHRHSVFKEMEGIIFEEIPVIPLSYSVRYAVLSKKIKLLGNANIFTSIRYLQPANN